MSEYSESEMKTMLGSFRAADAPLEAKSSFAGAPCSVSGLVASECRSIEPWIVNAARELAMDSAHVPLIARIIERHAPTPNARISASAPDNQQS